HVVANAVHEVGGGNGGDCSGGHAVTPRKRGRDCPWRDDRRRTLLAQECTFEEYTIPEESMASRRLSGENCDPAHCPIEVALEVIGGMWKVIVVRELRTGTKRYSELHRGLKNATHKMLA